jgi:Uma2 family endonuclease
MSVLLADPLVDALAASSGKAEIVGGRVVPLMSTGFLPNYVAFQIAKALDRYAEDHGGFAATDNLGFLVDLPDRGSFSPDAAYFTTPPEDAMDFVTGAPVLAVEVRSKGDYGPRAERGIAAKRADYFAAGTAAVWDVDPTDPLATVWLYTLDAPDAPTVFARADTAHAGDALPDFSVAVDALFPPPAR